ncbi:MAG: Uma2 family endonuclease [Microcoleus sp. PH2017_10_PVI_O_A]|uniref:Uma2 family endonuclease n=1 Tax=unclassified Microcoleus TaxID=2642155 RepID=UPI001DD820B6|nr:MULTISPECIES: Uma2 family endonuclease [unclassified Microcoleus]TAE75728.1 MAG: Uma2 family endonuclease [Oscillatoriales cyanobacterium]MCC3409406.1 Uma2 family endonuclease [Microcoleus sp. PH2017_10_PVI_O_A]MCC3463658.1 Uma2 family endonuclease [Microcoleus sp. PH2017_11_PCY_U_A]MCC3482022.1 Uma2 family endonuclease [Microcoleus sp. PH2017_12_PCY_D_A]MCC3531914.1 Uma2 family endonuclease [Microcoleus sp. PH2017_21_RUC_O_A]
MESQTIPLHSPLELTIELTDEQFFQLCQENRDLRFERTSTGELIIMPPASSDTGRRNAELSFQVQGWSRQNKHLGIAFDSSTGFKLPDGADISPDAAWIRRDRWDALTPAEKEKFAPICPDFVVELRSTTDSLEKLRAKMRLYMKNGSRLGWLLDRKNRQVEISRQGREVEILDAPRTVSGEDVLPGFVLDLTEIF